MSQRDDGFERDEEALWYKDAIIYEVHVRAFFDSDADGIGDFRGLTEKLDYLQDLGVTAIWLLPFYPSPLKDDGYDIADYTAVHESYGTLRDVKVFVREAHRRGLRVITELVCNHTSDQHPWFQRARRAKPGSPWRDFYVWSDTSEKYKEARIIFKDFEHSNWTWDPVANAYYWHRFYSHQPDLNFDNPRVRKAIMKTMDFWLQMGVDGLRLDAIPYLYEREGTNCENLPETHAFLRELRAHIDANYRHRMLLAEANQWPEDAVSYFGNGDECNMAFHFPLMPRMFMSIWMENRFPIIDILAQTPQIPETSQWALFLRNHDELTLEMVTDEERDYMYRVYANDPQARINLGIRRRLAPLLGNNRRRIELMNGLLFSLPGTPVIYYGDEIGMGDNIYLGDRNGVRTPMQWSPDRNAGFSAANRQRLYLPVVTDPEYHYEAINVSSQQNNPASLLWWMKRLIALRKRYKAFGRGTLEFLQPENRKVLVFIRQYEDEHILVVANLSRFVQCVEIDMSAYKGMVPIEMFGHVEFPPIGDLPYFITLGPHSFYWFSLEPQRVSGERIEGAGEPEELPLLTISGSWMSLFQNHGKDQLARVLPNYLRGRRWFGGKARRIKNTRVLDAIPVPYDSTQAYLTPVLVDYTEGDPETYLLPLTFAAGDRAAEVREWAPHALLAQVRTRDRQEGVLYDAVWDPGFCRALLDLIARRRRFEGEQGHLTGAATRALRQLRGSDGENLEPRISRAEQSNTSIIFGDRLIMKLFRRLEVGMNPDLEIGRFLTEKTSFSHIAQVGGSVEYRRPRQEPMNVAILQGFVHNEGDAWQYTLDSLSNYLERVLAEPDDVPAALLPPLHPLDLVQQELPQLARDLIGPYLESARLIGRRTAELHLALASSLDDPAFTSEPFTSFYQRSVYQSMRSLATLAFQTLRKSQARLPEHAAPAAAELLAREPEVFDRFRSVISRKIETMRIRIHGDYHLGQVLYTGHDFVIIDFEGEPARSLPERRMKRSPLRDVAGMMRSFHYAAYTALSSQAAAGGVQREQDREALEPWARFWYTWVSTVFLAEYLAVVGQASFLPHNRSDLAVLLDAFLLDKSVYELQYELNNRPTWIHIPLQGILQLLQATPIAAVSV